MKIYGVMESPDGEWRVEIVRRPGSRDFWYRLVHGDSELDWLTIGQVERILAEAGVDLGDLVDVPEQGSDEPGVEPNGGVA